MQDVSLESAAKDVLSSIDQLKEAFGSHGGGTLRAYLWAVAAGHNTYVDIAERIDITQSQASRAARTLHKLNYNGDVGLDLIDISFDLTNPRIKLVELNEQGLALLKAEYKTLTGKTIN